MHRPQVSNKQIYYGTSTNEREIHLNIGKSKHWFKDVSHFNSVPSFSSLPNSQAVSNKAPKSPQSRYNIITKQKNKAQKHISYPAAASYSLTLPNTPFRNLNLGPSNPSSRLSHTYQTYQIYSSLAIPNSIPTYPKASFITVFQQYPSDAPSFAPHPLNNHTSVFPSIIAPANHHIFSTTPS